MIRPTPSDVCCSTCLAMVAEFESDLIRLRAREGMKVAKAKGGSSRQAAQAEAEPGQAPAGAAQLRKLHPSRTRRTLRRRPIHDLPHHRADPTQATRTGAAIRTSRESQGVNAALAGRSHPLDSVEYSEPPPWLATTRLATQ